VLKVMKLYIFILSISCSLCSFASGNQVHLDKAPLDPTDYASLQRGAKTFMNTCSGCHGIQYTRYGSLAKGIGITDEQGKVLDKVVQDSLIFGNAAKMTDAIKTSMRTADAEKWFGTAPPDLSLVAKSKGADWVYTFLRSFYLDESRPWGVNNTVFEDVGMPHVLANLQGILVPEYKSTIHDIGGKQVEDKVISSLTLAHSGSLSTDEYDKVVADLVNFLSYVADPHQVERKNIGVFVIAFLVIFTVFAYLLKREYWKDVH
jgi:ubiquinol-cytochrome c reductase cytochrome c1 subunit